MESELHWSAFARGAIVEAIPAGSSQLDGKIRFSETRVGRYLLEISLVVAARSSIYSLHSRKLRRRFELITMIYNNSDNDCIKYPRSCGLMFKTPGLATQFG